MEILQTKGQIESGQFPTRMEVLKELKKRGVTVDEYSQLEKGFQGEQWVLEQFSEFGQSRWKVLKNIWLDSSGRFECDFLVLTVAGIYTFEIKNYAGHFEFKNSLCYLNGKKIGYNAIYQAQKAAANLENMMQRKFPRMKVQGSLLFVGEHNTVEIQNQVHDIQIVMRNQIRNHIWKISNDERNLQGPGLDVEACVQLLEQFETENPFGPEPVSPDISVKLHKGICCSYCGSFNVETNKSYVTCPCGMYEPRENAIVRTICEYGVIHFDKDLNTTELLDFFGKSISRQTLRKYLNIYFTKTGAGRGTKHLNLRLSFEKIQHVFKLKRASYLKF